MTPKNNYVTKDDLKQEIDGLKDFIEDSTTSIIKATAISFERVENRLGKVESRLGKVENKLDNVENRLGKVENELESLGSEVREVKRRVIDLETDVPTAKEFTNHGKRITKLEENVFAS